MREEKNIKGQFLPFLPCIEKNMQMNSKRWIKRRLLFLKRRRKKIFLNSFYVTMLFQKKTRKLTLTTISSFCTLLIFCFEKENREYLLEQQFLQVRTRLGPAQRLDHHGHAAYLGHLAMLKVPLFAGGLGSDLRRAGGRGGEQAGDGGRGGQAMGVARGDERRNEKVENLRKEARARYGGG